MTSPEQQPAGKLTPAAWRKIIAAIASLVAGGSAMSTTGASLDDLQPLLDKGGLIAAFGVFVYLGWTHAIGIVREAIAALWSIRDRMGEMVTKHAEMMAKQELHDARLDSVDDKLTSIDRRLDDLQTMHATNQQATR